jgi:hypothetical protein
VVIEFEFRLHRVSQVLGGLLAWPASVGGDVLRFWRDWVADAPDRVCTMAAFLYAPPAPFVPPEVQGTPIFAIASSGRCRPRRYRACSMTAFRAVHATTGDSGYVDRLTDEAIDAIVAQRPG